VEGYGCGGIGFGGVWRRNGLVGGDGVEGFGVLRLVAMLLAQDDVGLGGSGHGAAGAGVGREVAHGGGDDVDEESGALEVHSVACELVGDLAERALDGFASVEVFEQEGLVFDDGEDAVGAVVVTHHLVVHGDGAAAGAVLFGVVHALVGFGGFAVHRFVVVGHGVRVLCIYR